MAQDKEPIRIERLALRDLPAALAIQQQVYPGSLIENASVFSSRVELAHSYCLAPKSGGNLLGYLIAHGWRSDSPPPLGTVLTANGPAEILYMHDLGVARAGRGSGIGQALVDRALALAAQDGIREAQLIAVEGAGTYWERLGFGEGAASRELQAKVESYGPGSKWMTRRIGAIAMPEVLDEGPFFHGTVADLRVGDFLTAGYRSNYRPEVVMNHVYFTALVDGAGLAAEIAAELVEGEAVPRVYIVEPTGTFENDPNVTDKKFPGNPTRSYRSDAPLKVAGEVTDWTRLTPDALQMWRERLIARRPEERGEIIN